MATRVLNLFPHLFVKKWGWGKLDNDYKPYYIMYTAVDQIK